MADPLSITTSVVALATAAFQASKILYTAVNNFQSTKRIIRELKAEVGDLHHTLENLEKAAAEYEDDLVALKLPLHHCEIICHEFIKTINSFAVRSNDSHTSVRDWALMQWRGGDIAEFKLMLAGYKSTINIALGGATFRKVAVTAGVLTEYKDLIANTQSDLQEHLQGIEGRLEVIGSQQKHQAKEIHPDIQLIREEKDSTEQCLQICTEVLDCIHKAENRTGSQKGPDRVVGDGYFTPDRGSSMPHQRTRASLIDCKERLFSTSSSLKNRLVELERQLASASKSESFSEEDYWLKEIQKEKDSIIDCLNVCSDATSLAEQARVNQYEDIVSADYAHQLVVSTIGDLISAKHVVTGNKSIQWLGQMSNETLQSLSRD
ncbi:hypothetical protein ASPWEDRAFT_142113, partial [Aspergillus wentii DTO 134E9]